MKLSKRNTPVRRGHTFCAPFCGGGCTWEEYQRALSAAKDTARALGPGWKPHVWENLGWYAAAIDATGFWKVAVNLRPGRAATYTAFLGAPNHGSISGQWTGDGKTPGAAVLAARSAAVAYLRENLPIASVELQRPGLPLAAPTPDTRRRTP